MDLPPQIGIDCEVGWTMSLSTVFLLVRLSKTQREKYPSEGATSADGGKI